MKPIYVLSEMHERPNKAFSSIKKLSFYLTEKRNIINWDKDFSPLDAFNYWKKEPLDETYGNDFRISYHSVNGNHCTLLLSRVILR
jgi:hypothetical protein